jgi:hypothetical protein
VEPITVRFVWTADDLITGRKYAIKLNKWSPIGYGFTAIVGLAICIYASGAHRQKHGVMIAIFIGGMILLGIIIGVPFARMISRFLIRRRFAKRPDSGTEVVWEISDAGISTSTAQSKSENLWTSLQQVVSTPEGFLFMPNTEIFYFIPHRAFESGMDIERLKELARRCAAKFKECG